MPRTGRGRTSRTRSLSPSRSRSRSRGTRRRSPSDDRIRRSVSRELLREEEPPVQAIRRIVEGQQEFILELLSEHKAEVAEKIQTKSRRFSSKQIEKQFHVNAEFRDLANKTQVAFQAGEVNRAKEVLAVLCTKLEEHEHDLIIADTSPHSWLAVSKLRSGTDLPKSVRKRLAQVEKELAGRRQTNYGGAKKKFEAVQRTGQNYTGRRPDQRLSPEEALNNAAKQLRPGTCSHCHKGYHYYRECPEFWQKVNESREAKAKANPAGN